MSLETFNSIVKSITEEIAGKPLNDQLQLFLNERFPAGGEVFTTLKSECLAGIARGELCQHEAGGIRYGRIIKPSSETRDYSVDVVEMNEVVGPHHAHPMGEIDMIMPLSDDAKFDGHREGWLVYPSGSAHSPTVTGGKAVILYLLPQGQIQFS